MLLMSCLDNPKPDFHTRVKRVKEKHKYSKLYSDKKQTLCTSLGIAMTKHHQLKLDTFQIHFLTHEAQHNSKRKAFSWLFFPTNIITFGYQQRL